MVSRIKNQRRLLQIRAILHFLISLAFFAVFVGAITSYFILKKQYLHTVLAQYNTNVTATTDNVISYLQTYMQAAHRIAHSPEITSFLAKQQPLAEAFQKRLSEFSSSSIIFSPLREPLFASNGHTNWYEKLPPLDASLDRSQILSYVDISDFIVMPDQKHTLFITLPIFYDNKFVGSFAAEVPMQALQQLVSDYTGLGTTGEIIIAQHLDGKIKTIFPTRFNPQAAFTQVEPASDLYKVISQALNGATGMGVIHDRLVTWRYTSVTYAEWAIVVHGSYSEVVRPLLWLKIIIICLLILFFSGIIYFAYKSWLHARATMHLPNLLAKVLLIVGYCFFVVSSIMLVMFIKKQYQAYQFQYRKNNILFHGALQKAAQTIDYRITFLENEVSTLALELTRGAIAQDKIGATLAKEVQENENILGMVYALKKGNVWELQGALRDQGKVTIVTREAQESDPWLKEAQLYPASWIFAQTPWKHEQDPSYTLPFYDINDFEQKNPTGLVGIIYSQQAILAQAREKMGSLPILLVHNGKIIYKDSTINLADHTVDPTHNTNKRLYFEKAVHLDWFVGSMAKPEHLSKKQLFKIIAVLSALLSALGLFAFALLRFYQTDKRYEHVLLIATLLELACTIIAYLLH